MITRRTLINRCLMGSVGYTLAPLCSARIEVERRPHTFQIGACDWSIERKQSPEALKFAKQLGLDGVQVSFNGGENDLRDKATRELYVKTAAETGVNICSLAMGVLNGVPYSSSPDAERWVAECIEVMSTMKTEAAALSDKSLAAKVSPSIVLLAFFGKGDIKGDETKMKEVIKRLKKVAPKAEQAGVTIGLETWLDINDHMRILNEVGSPAVKVYYDTANANKMGYDIYQEIETLGSNNICEIHCKENATVLGNGLVDFPRVKRVIEKIDYKGWLVIESARARGLGVEKSYLHNRSYLSELFNG